MLGRNFVVIFGKKKKLILTVYVLKYRRVCIETIDSVSYSAFSD